jgi:crossover junction endodeoxyribonuclease RuvC
MGIDPGLATTGYAVVERDGARLRAAVVGAVTTPPGPASVRLARLKARLGEVVAERRPDVVVLERLFFNANVRTAMAVAQAAGVALCVAGEAGAEVASYTPPEVKQAVVGFGSAGKRQVQAMVAAVLALDAPPTPPDAADACALAICHLNRSGLRRAIGAAR